MFTIIWFRYIDYAIPIYCKILHNHYTYNGDYITSLPFYLPDCLPMLYHVVSGCTRSHNAMQYNNGQVILPLLQRRIEGIQTV